MDRAMDRKKWGHEPNFFPAIGISLPKRPGSSSIAGMPLVLIHMYVGGKNTLYALRACYARDNGFFIDGGTTMRVMGIGYHGFHY